MYLPKLFKTDDFSALQEIVSQNAFANLTVFNTRIFSTRAMMLLHGTTSNFYIETHTGKANSVAKNMNVEQEVLCDFLGINGYISSSWYDHVNVSTWNYEQVQIYGNVQILTEDELYKHLTEVTQKFEHTQKCPMTLDKMHREYVNSEMQGAVGYRIFPTEVKIKQKFSQNRDEVNLQRIVENLSESELDMDKKMIEKIKKINSF